MGRFHVYISGKVQGVGFRASTRRKAEKLSVNGWVRNLPDGRVEAAVEGEEDKVQRMLEFFEEGPRYAEVENVEADKEAVEGLESFEIRR